MEPIVYYCAGAACGMGLSLLLCHIKRAWLYRELSWITSGLKLVQGMSEERCQEAFHWSKEEAIAKYMKRLERLIPYQYMHRFEEEVQKCGSE